MPCLDEAETVGSCVRQARSWLERSGVDGEVIVADNGSSDGSQALAEAEGARVVPIPRRGYGAALLGGIEAARGTFVVMGDSDESYDFAALDPVLAELRDGADLVMGNRFRGGIADGAMPWLHRYVGNPVLSGIGRLFFHIPVRDFHCGLRGFRRDRVLDLDLRTPGMEFASEMVVKAALAELDIREVPTTLSPDGRTRPPHLRTWSDGWRHLRFLLLFSPRWLFLIPGLIAFIGGLLLTGILLAGPIEIGRFGLDVSALVYAAGATIAGFHAVSFALFTKILAISRGFLPPDDRINRLGGTFRLERGLLVGSLVLAIGLGTAIVSFLRWGDAGWSGLDPGEQLRLVVPAMLGIVLGSSILLTSFYLSILGMDADIEYTS
jgi:glycosyltransferase involved in cell wall biosynthesis